MANKIMIPWSGGFDSTLCVLMALEQGHDIYTVYSKLGNNPVSMDIEYDARHNIMKEIRKANFNIRQPVKIIDGTISSSGIVPFKQLPLWLTTVVYALEDNTTSIWLGFKRNDDAISLIDEMRAVWSALYNAIFIFHKFNYESLFSSAPTAEPPLEFPVKSLGRKDVIAYIRMFDQKHNTNVLQYCYTCESGDILTTPNCTCTSCGEYKWAMGEYQYTEHRNHILKMMGRDVVPGKVLDEVVLTKDIDVFAKTPIDSIVTTLDITGGESDADNIKAVKDKLGIKTPVATKIAVSKRGKSKSKSVKKPAKRSPRKSATK